MLPSPALPWAAGRPGLVLFGCAVLVALAIGFGLTGIADVERTPLAGRGQRDGEVDEASRGTGRHGWSLLWWSGRRRGATASVAPLLVPAAVEVRRHVRVPVLSNTNTLARASVSSA